MPWKVLEPDIFLYGEDIYGVHSIEYDPVPENETFYAFALRFADGSFSSFQALVKYAREHEIPVVPVLYEGVFQSVDEIKNFVSLAHRAFYVRRSKGGCGDQVGASVSG